MDKKYVTGVVDELKTVIGDGYVVSVSEVLKNNGIRKHGIHIGKEGNGAVTAVVYLEEVLDNAIQQTEAEAALRVVEAYRNSYDSSLEETAVEFLSTMNKKKILDMVIYRIVNQEKNAEILDNAPHIRFLDLAATFHVDIQTHGHIAESFRINNDMCEKYAIGFQELDAAARRNTEASGFTCINMVESMARLVPIPTDDFGILPMYVFTNNSNTFGASVLLYPRYFMELSRKLDNDLFVLPSSVHEVIAIPASGIAVPKLVKIVRDINADILSGEEILSDSVYRYIRHTGTIEMA